MLDVGGYKFLNLYPTACVGGVLCWVIPDARTTDFANSQEGEGHSALSVRDRLDRVDNTSGVKQSGLREGAFSVCIVYR